MVDEQRPLRYGNSDGHQEIAEPQQIQSAGATLWAQLSPSEHSLLTMSGRSRAEALVVDGIGDLFLVN